MSTCFHPIREDNSAFSWHKRWFLTNVLFVEIANAFQFLLSIFTDNVFYCCSSLMLALRRCKHRSIAKYWSWLNFMHLSKLKLACWLAAIRSNDELKKPISTYPGNNDSTIDRQWKEQHARKTKVVLFWICFIVLTWTRSIVIEWKWICTNLYGLIIDVRMRKFFVDGIDLRHL
jgi:hypothetical protein